MATCGSGSEPYTVIEIRLTGTLKKDSGVYCLEEYDTFIGQDFC
jgi:hypothetical protein